MIPASAMVTELHQTYGLPINTELTFDVPEDVRELRAKLLVEEVEEAVESIQENDVYNLAKELADVVYVAYGCAITYGINLDKVFNEVHRSNMSKLGEDGKPILREDGKVLKGPNYFAPDIKSLLENDND